MPYVQTCAKTINAQLTDTVKNTIITSHGFSKIVKINFKKKNYERKRDLKARKKTELMQQTTVQQLQNTIYTAGMIEELFQDSQSRTNNHVTNFKYSHACTTSQILENM